LSQHIFYILSAHSVEKVYWVDETLESMMMNELSIENESSAFEANERDNWVSYTLINEIVMWLFELLMFVVLLTSEALVTETTFEVETKFSSQRVTVTVTASEQLNEVAAIRVARIKIVIWQKIFILKSSCSVNDLY